MSSSVDFRLFLYDNYREFPMRTIAKSAVLWKRM